MPTKVHLVKASVFPVVMYGCESWTVKKAERRRIDAFELWCWKRLLGVPWTARKSNQSILKEICPEYSLEGLMVKLKLQYFGHLMRRTDAFELCCWRRVLRVPWTVRTWNQSILKEICPEYSSEGLMLKLKLQYFGHLIRRVDSLEKILMLGGIEGRRRRGRQRMSGWMASRTLWTWAWVNSRSWWWTGRPGMLQFMGLQRVGHDWATEWTELNSNKEIKI